MVRPLLADPPGWHHITGALHLAARFCSLQSAVCCILPIPPFNCTEHSISTVRATGDQSMNPASFEQMRPLWHLCFWATVLVLLGSSATHCTSENPVSGADRVLHGSLPTPMLTSTSTLQTCFFVCFVRLASRSTSQPSRNPRGPVTRVWDQPMHPCSPEASDGLGGGGVLVSFLSAPILAHARLSALSVPFSSRQYKQSPCPAHASVLDMLLPSTRMLYRTLPITLVPGP
ncbi:hypothetical protein GGI35DRAFT_421891 [Trichoderma velutinum]